MQKVISKETMQQSDKYTIQNKITSLKLMDKAALAVMQSYDFKEKTLIVTGTGNNAGDGYALANHLKEKGIQVEILLTENKFSKDGKYYFDLCLKNNIPTYLYEGNFNFKNYNILVDAIYGIGFHGNMPKQIANLINQMNETKIPIISIDINSGLNANNGRASTCIHSTLTVSIGALKPGHLLNMAKDNINNLINQNININIIGDTYYLLEDNDFQDILPKRLNFSHKGSYGLVGILGGCQNYSGSAKLANLSLSALTSGAGVARLIVANSLVQSISPYLLESTIYSIPDKNGQMIYNKESVDKALEKVTALLIGIGWNQTKDNEEILNYIINNYDIPIVVDADGLNTLAKTKKLKPGLILTPHLKEFSRLTGKSIEEITKDPIQIAKTYAKRNNITLLLKGPSTIVTDGKEVYIVDKGCPGMATAGSGDVLSGIIIGLLGYLKPTLKTIAFAAYINGLAGMLAEQEKGSVSMIASDTVKHINTIIKKFIKN